MTWAYYHDEHPILMCLECEGTGLRDGTDCTICDGLGELHEVHCDACPTDTVPVLELGCWWCAEQGLYLCGPCARDEYRHLEECEGHIVKTLCIHGRSKRERCDRCDPPEGGV